MPDFTLISMLSLLANSLNVWQDGHFVTTFSKDNFHTFLAMTNPQEGQTKLTLPSPSIIGIVFSL
jgi:hypothetical protein